MSQDVGTTDIVLSAALRCHGFALDRIEKENNRGTFYFSGVPEEFLKSYDLGGCLVEPTAFHTAIKTLTTAVRRFG